MKFYQIYFSPTGGTKRAADLFVRAWGAAWEEIDLSDPRRAFSQEAFEEEDILLVAVPSFGGRVPDAAGRRLSQMAGNQARAILLCVYGNRAYDDTLLELEDLLLSAGFRCSAAIAAVAQHSIMRRFAAGRPDRVDEADLQSFAEQVRQHLNKNGIQGPVQLPGNRPYRAYSGIPLKPKGNHKCTACGLCARKCPVEAIDPANPKDTDAGRCISCMRCAAICPSHARTVSRIMVALSTQKMKKVCTPRKENELFL